MNHDVLPFLHGASLETTGQIRTFCLDLQKKITKSLARCTLENPASYRSREIAKNIRLAINEEAERGAQLTKNLIAAGALTKNKENNKLTSALGYIESDGEVMVLFSMFDNWAEETGLPVDTIVLEKIGCTPYEALLVYSYDCVDIFSSSVVKKNNRSEVRYFLSVDKDSAIRRCNNAAEAWSFSRLPLLLGWDKGGTANRNSALQKHFYKDHSELYADHVVINLVTQWSESVKARSFQVKLDSVQLENQALECLKFWKAEDEKECLKKIAKRIVKTHIYNATKEIASFFINARNPAEEDCKWVSDIICSSAPSLSGRRVRGVVRQHFLDVKSEIAEKGIAY
ncbi:hypothetical protein ABD440_24525 [Chromobacterium piscinae]